MSICLNCKKETKNPKYCSLKCQGIHQGPERSKYNRGKKLLKQIEKTSICEYCKSSFTYIDAEKYKERRFCNIHCARSYSATFFIENKTKNVKCIDCKKEFMVNFRTNSKVSRCDICRDLYYENKFKRKCKICGQYRCLRRDICLTHNVQVFPSLIKYFGFDKFKIGTPEVYQEFDRVKDLLIEDYINNELSSRDIAKKYGFLDITTPLNFLRSFKIIPRSFSNSVSLAWQQGKISLSTTPTYPYKQGWHTTWNDKKYFLRSSYELEYAKLLDEQKIDYVVEGLRIVYWNSQLQRQAVAIPDFHLLESKTIVEIKSNYTYNEQEMRDRFEAFRKLGFNCKLILDKNEVILPQ